MSVQQNGNGWELYQFLPSFILGFHGCDESVGEAILRGDKEHLKKSQNDYDWLGRGIYFWESNPQRAWEFATERSEGGKNSKGYIKRPFVLGAVINLGYCLNMCDGSALGEVKRSFYDLKILLESTGEPLPQNSQGMKMRKLDCAVFNFVHVKREAETPTLRPYDTVRATYHEGAALYEGTDIKHQDHTQICVLNSASILGYFRPIQT